MNTEPGDDAVLQELAANTRADPRTPTKMEWTAPMVSRLKLNQTEAGTGPVADNDGLS